MATPQASMDAKAGTENLLNSLSSVDDEDSNNYVQRDPNDPTRFFQQVRSRSLAESGRM
jgi:hypothetical protein